METGKYIRKYIYSAHRNIAHKLCCIIIGFAVLIGWLVGWLNVNASTAGSNTMNPFMLDDIYYADMSDEEINVLRNTEQILYSKGFDHTSARYKAIQTGITMLGWEYSKSNRWGYTESETAKASGSRDCSSFVYTCYRPYTTFIDDTEEYGISTQSLLKTARATGVGYRYSSLVKYLQDVYRDEWMLHLDDDPDRYILPGDIVLCTGNWMRTEGIGHAMIYLSDGYVIHATDNDPGCVVIGKYQRWGIYGDQACVEAGPRYILPIPASYDTNIAFSEMFSDYKIADKIRKCFVPFNEVYNIIRKFFQYK